MSGLEALAAALRESGGTVAELLDGVEAPGPGGRGPAQIAAAGPRARGREREYELIVEMILEGSRLHYGPRRLVRTTDEDLALLIGDQLYALGLSRLAELGDLEAVGALADVIAAVARASLEEDGAAVAEAWSLGARRTGGDGALGELVR